MDRKLSLLATGLTLGLVVIILGGCAGTSKEMTSPEQNAPVKNNVTESVVKETKAPEPPILSGKVAETVDSGGYTYVNLEKDGKKVWIAMPPTKLTVGQEIVVRPGTQMGKFTSRTLQKTFDDIYFTSGLVTDTKSSSTPSQASGDTNSLPQGHPSLNSNPQIATPSAQALPKGHMDVTSQPAKEIALISGKVLETMDSGGYSYIRLDNGSKNVWVAVPSAKVSVGQEIKLQPGAEFTNFKSKTLNRTFDSIIFSAGVVSPATK